MRPPEVRKTWSVPVFSDTVSSDIGFDRLPVLPHPVAPTLGLARIHQQLEGLARFLGLLGVELHANEPPRIRVHRRLPELLRAHLAQALEARDFPDDFLDFILLVLVG